jgi:hypothetical protein
VLVNQIPERIEVFERQPSGDFVHRVAGRGETLPIACLGGHMEVDVLYVGAV